MRERIRSKVSSLDPARRNADLNGTEDSALGASLRVLQAISVTLTVTTGPLVAVVYRLTRSPGAATGGLSVAQALRGLLCTLMLLCLFLSRRLRLLNNRHIRPLLFLAACAVLTSPIHPRPFENVVFGVKLVFLTLVFASAFRLAEEGVCTERWLTACAWFIVLNVAVCIAVGSATGRTVEVYESRYATAGLIGAPGVASALTLSALPVFLRSIPSSGSAIVGLAVLLTSLFFTMCRTSLIAAVAATCVASLISLASLRGQMPWRKMAATGGILILLASIGLRTSAGADLIARFKDLNPLEGTGSGRYTFWRVSLGHIVNRPTRVQLQGEGLGSIRAVIGRQTGLLIGAHNDWLDLVHSLGLFGLVGLSWWYLELARLARRFHGRRDGLFQGTCATFVMLGAISMGTGGFYQPSWALSYVALGYWAGRAERIASGAELHAHSSRIERPSAGKVRGRAVSLSAGPEN